MFCFTEAEATAIRDAFHQRGEFAAAIELRRLCAMLAGRQRI